MGKIILRNILAFSLDLKVMINNYSTPVIHPWRNVCICTSLVLTPRGHLANI